MATDKKPWKSAKTDTPSYPGYTFIILDSNEVERKISC